ncbi:MAG TPA: thioredoxin domain-containing protein [Anaerolineae bacterium]
MSNVKTKGILPLLFSFFLLLAACGPAVVSDEAASNEQELTDGGKSGGATNENETDTGDASAQLDAGTAEATRPTVSVDSTSSETDARGVEVGFTEDGHAYRGNPEAPVVIEEFSDYQCPFCGRFVSQTLSALDVNEIASGEVVLVYYDFPLTNIHPQATAAANAARCAGEHGAAAYWAMHDLLFANPGQWSVQDANAVFSTYGEDLGLDRARFNECLESERYGEAIQADVDLGLSRGVSSTPTFFINEQPLVGAQPLTVFTDAIAVVQEGGQIAAAQPSEPATGPVLAPTPAAIPDENVAGTLGNPDAPVRIVEYSDYQCPYCQRHSLQTLPQILSQMIEAGQVYYVFKDFPLESIHPEARAAANAARCAGDQDAYWPMHDALFASQDQWANQGTAASDVFTTLAADLELNVAAFDECLAAGQHDAVVQASIDEALSLGVSSTPTFFIDGYPMAGAQPFEVFAFAVERAQAGTLADVYREQAERAAAQQQAPPEPSGPVDVPIDDAYSIGDPDAPVTIVEYTDFQCPYCSRHFHQTLPLLKENFIDTGQVRYVFKDFPLTSIHPQAFAAAEAARCAGEQEAYVEMHDLLFSKQEEWSGRPDVAGIFGQYAAQLNLDTAQFDACLSSHKYEAAVTADLEEGTGFGIRGTPAFFINGHYLSGAQPYSVFEQAISSLASE